MYRLGTRQWSNRWLLVPPLLPLVPLALGLLLERSGAPMHIHSFGGGVMVLGFGGGALLATAVLACAIVASALSMVLVPEARTARNALGLGLGALSAALYAWYFLD